MNVISRLQCKGTKKREDGKGKSEEFTTVTKSF